MLFQMPAETAHEIGIETLKVVLGAKFIRNLAAKRFDADTDEPIERFGLSFRNPLGMAAGFDKNGVVVNQLAALGFGFVEVGTVTYEPQSGNEKPRLFRLPDDMALINRLGFNNEGTPKVVKRLKKIHPNCILGVNIGKNKDVSNEDAAENYLKSFDLAHEVADYITINVSSPNTPNLRELQKAENLERLLNALQKRNRERSNAAKPKGQRASRRRTILVPGGQREGGVTMKPLFIKIAPDLSDEEIERLVDTCLRLNIAGIIATNTTTKRERLKTENIYLEKIGAGGLSGKSLGSISNYVISKIFKLSKGKLPIIGVGGIFDAKDAFEKISAGACLLQAYTGFIYHGPTFAKDVNTGLSAILKAGGFDDLDSAVGSSLVNERPIRAV